MEKMVNSNGAQANMCCASRNIKRWCTKKDKAIIDGRSKCGYYVMAEFFQKKRL